MNEIDIGAVKCYSTIFNCERYTVVTISKIIKYDVLINVLTGLCVIDLKTRPIYTSYKNN